jgi:hypothetical protein
MIKFFFFFLVTTIIKFPHLTTFSLFFLQYTGPRTSNQHLSWRGYIFHSTSHIWTHPLCTSDWQHAGLEPSLSYNFCIHINSHFFGLETTEVSGSDAFFYIDSL